MPLIEQIPDPYVASFVLGLLYGLTFCTLTCLPYILSYIAGIGVGFRKGVLVTSIYNSGRVAAYAILGGLTGILKIVLSNTFFVSYQKYTLIAFGAAITIIGVSILVRKESFECKGEHEHLGINDKLMRNFDIRAFLMGFTNGLILCPPLVALLLYSLTLFSPLDCFFLSILFGLGTAISPLLLLGGVVGWLLNKAPFFRVWISRISAIILILLGFNLILSALGVLQ